MKYIKDTVEFYSEHPSVITLGKFDGLHRGHQKLIREVVRLQKEEQLYGIVFTIAPGDQKVLLTAEEKQKLLEAQGVDCMIRCPFIPQILSMKPEDFVAEILIKKLKARCIVVGTDFRFGHQRSGDVALLQKLQKRYGYTLRVLEKECCDGQVISSTRIRKALTEGNMELVHQLLGYAYLINGSILHGQALGRRIGIPTINQIPDTLKLLPPAGVYFSDVICQNRQYCGMTNIGYKPTVDGSFLGVETYLYGGKEELYGAEASVYVRSFRRTEMKFSSIEELKKQIEQDVAAGKEYFDVR